MSDYYGILGVKPDATVDEIREAYRRRAFEWHPDRNLHRHAEAHARFLDLGEAYAVLKDVRSRMEYDLSRPVSDGPSVAEDVPSSSTPEWAPPDDAAPRGASGWEFEGEDEEQEPAPPHGSGAQAPSLREYRARVRQLARELAAADRQGRVVDLVMMAAVLVTLVVALLLSLFKLIGNDIPELPLTFWPVVIAWMVELVLLAWLFSLRERRVEQYEPYAEEVLERTGRGWRGPEPPNVTPQ